MKFRDDINALRAVAVIGVLLFHYKAPHFGGGFAGVDVFFVISGYLMTRIIDDSIDQNNFSLKEFYVKRLKRILPALLVLVGAIMVLGFFIYFPIDYLATVKNAITSILFVSNIFYWKSSNYFAPASDTNVLLHTWSLSVEWQFYLLYPVILAFLNKHIRNKTIYLRLFIGLTVLAFLLSFTVTHYDSTASFYLLPTRSWEMLIGGIAFYINNRIKDSRGKALAAIIGYALILWSFLVINEEVPWPGIYTFIPVTGTFLVLMANWHNPKILRVGIVQFFGKISYSLYLWHWPVYVIAVYVGVARNIISLPILMSLSIGLAYLSYRYVESVKYRSSFKILFSAGMLSTIAIVLSLTNANSVLFKKESLLLSSYANDHKSEIDLQFNTGKCFISSGHGKGKFDSGECLCRNNSVKNILLIGDSHSAQLSENLRKFLSRKSIYLSQATASGCIPILKLNGATSCSDIISYVYQDYIAKQACRIDGVILSANWINSREDNVTLLSGILTTVQFLEKHNLKVIIIGQNETYTMPYPYIAAWEEELNFKIARRFITKRSHTVNNFLKERLKPYYVNIYNTDSIPNISPNATPYMFDDHHVTNYGAELIIQKILRDPVGKSFLYEIVQRN